MMPRHFAAHDEVAVELAVDVVEEHDHTGVRIHSVGATPRTARADVVRRGRR